MNKVAQKIIINKNINLIKKRQIGFVNTYCDFVKNQVMNDISVCDMVKDILSDEIKTKLHNVENELLTP